MEEDKNPVTPPPSTVPDDIPDSEMPPPPVLDDETPPKPPQLKKSPKKGLLVVLIVIVVLGIAGATGWFFFMRNNDQPSSQANKPAAETPAATDDVPEATNTETFTSSPYRITFQYPKTWTVTEDNDNSFVVQSQEFTYKLAAGGTKKGYFRIYVSKPADAADSAIIAKGVAIQPSTKLVYTKPTPAQRTETNLSVFGQDTENNFAFLLITGNFALQKGDTLGPNFGKEIETILIGGGYSDPSLTQGMAMNPVPVNGAQDTNAYKQAIAIIQSFEIM